MDIDMDVNFNIYRRPPNWKKARASASHDSDVERCQEEPAQKYCATPNRSEGRCVRFVFLGKSYIR